MVRDSPVHWKHIYYHVGASCQSVFNAGCRMPRAGAGVIRGRGRDVLGWEVGGGLCLGAHVHL